VVRRTLNNPFGVNGERETGSAGERDFLFSGNIIMQKRRRVAQEAARPREGEKESAITLGTK
jgi:hypothetical protein